MVVEQHAEVVSNFLDEVACGWGTCMPFHSFCSRYVLHYKVGLKPKIILDSRVAALVQRYVFSREAWSSLGYFTVSVLLGPSCDSFFLNKLVWCQVSFANHSATILIQSWQNPITPSTSELYLSTVSGDLTLSFYWLVKIFPLCSLRPHLDLYLKWISSGSSNKILEHVNILHRKFWIPRLGDSIFLLLTISKMPGALPHSRINKGPMKITSGSDNNLP